MPSRYGRIDRNIRLAGREKNRCCFGMSEIGDLSRAGDELAKAASRIAHHYTTPKPPEEKSFFDDLKVPLTTIGVTTLLSVWLIPSITGTSINPHFAVSGI
jgi:hypothetical protein